MVTNTEMNIWEKNIVDNGPDYIVAGSNYFLAEIETPFHSGEAVIKLDKDKNLWYCLFTLYNRVIDAIYSIPIEKDAIVKIIMEKNAETFNEFV